MRPRTPNRQAQGQFGGSPTKDSASPQKPSKARPTSAGGPLSSFGAVAKLERKNLSELTELDAEDDADWQSKALARFVFLDPKSLEIRFSSPALPRDYAQGLSFMSQIEKYNASDVVKQVKKALNDKEACDIPVKLGIWRENQEPVHGGQTVHMSVTPLIEKKQKVGGIVVLLTIA